jgi:cellulose synthase/poly-beta-1,6-N-acetylglucosamine synthase-like glycosyltransferase
MDCFLEIIFITLISCFTLLIFFAILLPFVKQVRSESRSSKIKLQELTLVIPYRNEINRIFPLLDSLKNQVKLPHTIIFVDDHSDDKTADFIDLSLRNLSCEVHFLSLPNLLKGKKQAILLGVKSATTKFVHTMDADVFMDVNFFTNLEKTEKADMLILPVNMIGKGFVGNLMELEYGSFQLIQCAFGKQKPMMASGANLVFNRTSYLEINKVNEHVHFASGDDQFALNAFLNKNKEVRVLFEDKFRVNTAVPQTIKELFQQRLRWMSKNKELFEWKGFLLSFGQFAIQFLFLFLTIRFLVRNQFFDLFLVLSIKIIAEMIQFSPILIKKDKIHLIVSLPILSLIYPVYLMSLAFLSVFYRPLWKDRKLVEKIGA